MVFMTFPVSVSTSGVSGVFLLFLMHLLSFSLCAELLKESSRAGEGMPDSSWLVVFDVFELSEPIPDSYIAERDDVAHSKH